ncbi:perlucin-like isoform X2 [Sander vitreus]
MADYINSQVTGEMSSLEERENVHSGGSKVYRVVGVSFGLLCIIQSFLNISLRLQQIGFCNKSDQMRDNEMLKDQLRRQQDQIMELQTERKSLIMRLSEMEPKTQGCPWGWQLYMSSCYFISTVKETWKNAQNYCVAKEAHLVVLNDRGEEDALRAFGSQGAWIGLSSQRNGRLNTFTWVDGSPLTNTDRIQQPVDQRLRCAYADTMNWVLSNCKEQHYWVCEKKRLC